MTRVSSNTKTIGISIPTISVETVMSLRGSLCLCLWFSLSFPLTKVVTMAIAIGSSITIEISMTIEIAITISGISSINSMGFSLCLSLAEMMD